MLTAALVAGAAGIGVGVVTGWVLGVAAERLRWRRDCAGTELLEQLAREHGARLELRQP